MYADKCQSTSRKRNLNANVDKGEVILFKRAITVMMIDFVTCYQARVLEGEDGGWEYGSMEKGTRKESSG